MEGRSTIVASAAKEMDQMLKGVMPDTWMGHARLAAEAHDLSQQRQEKALRYTKELVEEKDYPSEKALDAVVSKLEE
jgi:hypothetical protein